MKRARLSSVLALLLVAPAVHSRPLNNTELRAEQPDLSPSAPRGAFTGLSSTLFTDTVSYGGTWWAPDSLRWEAIRDSCWTFDSGVGSSINTGGNPNKPPGYHQQMEGWFGIDQTLSSPAYFRRSSTCAINGSFSAWAGVTLSEANGLCYASGQGYGNSWDLFLCKSFAYPGAGNVALSYKYAVACEAGFDYAYVIIDTTGAAEPGSGGIQLAVYSGLLSGTETINLTRGVTLPAGPKTVNIWFNARSDGSYSDEDGLNPTLCGHSAFDDISLTGAITDFTDFESGSNGWAQTIPSTAVGDYSNLADMADLQPPATFCPCSATDSVLVFFDETFGHPTDQDNVAASPWINLKRPANAADLGRPLKLMLYSVYAEMPIANYVFVQIRVRSYPEICPFTGLLYRTPWRDQNIVFYFGETPFCSAAGTTQIRDYSALIGTAAEQIQVAYGTIMLCRTAPFGFPCSGTTNTTPWLDNISLGIGGSATAPTVTLLTFDALQDNFAQDGTLNPGSPGRLDSNTIKDGSSPLPGTHLRDTLVARTGVSTNTEVRIYFAVRPGPLTSLPNLTARAARWTPVAGIPPTPGAFGSTWYCARMDTAEQGGAVSAGNYMAAFHELDPGFQGTDRSADPADPSQLENEILPDRILSPGSRVDYFLASRYIPPDPRNVGGVNWFLERDTTGGRYREVEILPSSCRADTTWNCVLYVDHHADRSFDEQAVEEQGLNAALGAGAGNAEQTLFDRFDNETPSSGQLSFGRTIQTNYGCSAIQIFGYRALTWHCATLTSLDLTDEDANVIRPWLTLTEINGARQFWGSGDGLVRSMSTSNETQTVSFMQNILGVLARCNTIREAGCPAGSLLDSTYCLPLAAEAGSYFPTTLPASVRGNGCNALRSFDVNSANSSVTTAKGQLNYLKNGAVTGLASVTNYNTLDVEYRTVTDGFAVAAMRLPAGDPHSPAACVDVTPALARTADVLTWFSVAAICGIPQQGAAPEDTIPGSPKYRTGLGNAVPNPMSRSTVIRFENAREGGHIVIEIVDVTGRLVRTLVDSEFPAGVQTITWDGLGEGGRPVSAGLYFYRLSSGGTVEARKLLVVR